MHPSSDRFALDDCHPCRGRSLDRFGDFEARGPVKRSILPFAALTATRSDDHVEVGKKWVGKASVGANHGFEYQQASQGGDRGADNLQDCSLPPSRFRSRMPCAA
jgi:hypothetical protein